MLTPATFQAAFPAFANVEQPDTQRWLTASVPWFDVGAWGALYDEGLGNWVAHRLIMEAASAGKACGGMANSDKLADLASMPVISKSVDSVSITYSANLLAMQVRDPFLRTFYGQQYRYLVSIVGGGAVAV